MDAVGRSQPFFVSRHHEYPPATLEELLRASVKRDDAAKTSDADSKESAPAAASDDSDSDYRDVESDGDFDDSEPEVDEWRLHTAEPREGLYLHEMRRQRGRMGEKEAQWVRGYIKAQRAWKARTGCSIDEFHIPGSITRRMKNGRWLKKANEPLVQDEEEDVTLFAGITRLETILLLAAIVFVSLSLGVQLYASISNAPA
ncbi:unnamed protein product [Phytophthora fragariaefolia]|uniref:Unnamed protein product n=1 Tax=Phytophthora fragariaefolia TaxID=1490495 RepID=A0A9W7CQ14_9STRA|nr:unnamed protein product [Phytophthora fragariaefolia]